MRLGQNRSLYSGIIGLVMIMSAGCFQTGRWNASSQQTIRRRASFELCDESEPTPHLVPMANFGEPTDTVRRDWPIRQWGVHCGRIRGVYVFTGSHPQEPGGVWVLNRQIVRRNP
ncbi:MAG: hypothetical protein AAGF12_34515 [Myxococcota bacterium]